MFGFCCLFLQFMFSDELGTFTSLSLLLLPWPCALLVSEVGSAHEALFSGFFFLEQ